MDTEGYFLLHMYCYVYDADEAIVYHSDSILVKGQLYLGGLCPIPATFDHRRIVYFVKLALLQCSNMGPSCLWNMHMQLH